jgi:hypothetical protein
MEARIKNQEKVFDILGVCNMSSNLCDDIFAG